MKMTRRNFLSTSAVAALACGASLTAHAAGSTDENSLNFITDIILQSGPSVFKFNLKRTVIFLHKNFRVCNRSKQGELVPPRNF